MKRFFLLFLACASAHASTLPKWLTLPGSEVKPPSGVSAWILHDSLLLTQEDESTVVRRHRYAVMPLSDAGVKSTVCFEQYVVGAEELVSARAWVVSPDGKKSRAFGGSEFIAYSPMISQWTWDQTTSAYFRPVRYLEPGWIVAWEVEIRSKFGAFDFNWLPERFVPIRYAALEIRPLPGGEVKWKTNASILSKPNAGVGDQAGAVSWSLSDLPALASEVPEGMEPNQKEVRAVFLSPHRGKVNPKTWADVTQEVLAQMEPKRDSSPALEAMARQLAGKGNLWQQVEPICRFVQKEIAYLEITIFTDSMAGYRPHRASEVFENRYGDCKDKATLLCSMLRALGVGARVMLVNHGEPGRNSSDWPSAQFNHAIVAIDAKEPVPAGWPKVNSGGKDYVLFDPTDETLPLGQLPFGDTCGLGLVLDQGVDAPVVIPPPSSGEESVSSVIVYDLMEDGSAKIATREERTGTYGSRSLGQDETLSIDERTERLEQRLRKSTPLVSDLTWENNNDLPHHMWKQSARFQAKFVSKPISRAGLQVTPDLMSQVGRTAPWAEGLEGKFALAPRSAQREFRLNLPEGWTFTEVPPDWSVKTTAGEADVSYRREGNSVIGEVKLSLSGGLVERQGYLEARELLRGTISAERRPIVVTRPAPSAAASAH